MHDDDGLSADDLDLMDLFRSGAQTGFGSTLNLLLGAQVINVVMHPWRARDWTVTLGAMKNGSIPVSGLVAGVPPDNQVAIAIGASGIGAPPEVANYLINGIYVKVFWGTGNAQEMAFVSWPFGGCTLQLHGALVRVEIPPGFNLGNLNPGQFIPQLSGFVTPNARRDGGMLSPPTLITGQQSMVNAAGGVAGVDFWAPPRAVGYRLYTTVDVDADFDPVFVVQQALWLGGLPTSKFALDGTNVDVFRGNSNTLNVSAGNAWQRATGQPNDWRRLLPGAVGLHIAVPNAQNGTNLSVGVEWILDIG